MKFAMMFKSKQKKYGGAPLASYFNKKHFSSKNCNVEKRRKLLSDIAQTFPQFLTHQTESMYKSNPYFILKRYL